MLVSCHINHPQFITKLDLDQLDQVLLNKVDAVSPEKLKRTISAIRSVRTRLGERAIGKGRNHEDFRGSDEIWEERTRER